MDNFAVCRFSEIASTYSHANVHRLGVSHVPLVVVKVCAHPTRTAHNALVVSMVTKSYFYFPWVLECVVVVVFFFFFFFATAKVIQASCKYHGDINLVKDLFSMFAKKNISSKFIFNSSSRTSRFSRDSGG